MRHKHSLISFMVSASVCTGLGTDTFGAAASFQGLGDLPGGYFYSQAYAVSADGLVVVGKSEVQTGVGGSEAFRWTADDGMVAMSDLEGGVFSGGAYAVSADGSVIVGIISVNDNAQAIRWEDNVGTIQLGELAGGIEYSDTFGVSADGSVVVGMSVSSVGFEAYRWTAESGMVGLGVLSDGPNYSIARAVSADGSVVVGESNTTEGDVAFRWTSSGGMVPMTNLQDGVSISRASSVNDDGSVIVGGFYSISNAWREAFRWTPEDGAVGLGHINPIGTVFSSNAYDVSADGSVIVGVSTTDSDERAFIWDQIHGMRDLNVVLSNLGVDLTGWTLEEARSISSDGLTIVGNGINPDGNEEAFIAVIPEPGMMLISGAGVLVLFKRRVRGQVL